jgi:hypothetical protein
VCVFRAAVFVCRRVCWQKHLRYILWCNAPSIDVIEHSVHTMCLPLPPAAAPCCPLLLLSASDADKANAVLPIGGPGKALSAKEQADILFRCVGPDAAQARAPAEHCGFLVLHGGVAAMTGLQ